MDTVKATKIKIGFGPETTANSFHQSGLKIARELNKDGKLECSFFREPFDYATLRSFDVLIFIKICPEYGILRRLKDEGKALILDYQDMFLFPSAYERKPIKKLLKKIYYYKLETKEKRRYRLFDTCFVASPIAEKVVREAGMKSFYLFRQIYNDWNRNNPKKHNGKKGGLTIFWTGAPTNIYQNRQVAPVLRRICKRYNPKVLYLTQADKGINDFIEYKKWSIDTWERDLLEADIAFRWWEHSNDQYHKDSNKIISYMAAGLPVVCRPTHSDRSIVEHGKTGFFAEDPEEFGKILEHLIQNPQLRREIGERAFTDVWTKHSLGKHVEKIKESVSRILNVN